MGDCLFRDGEIYTRAQISSLIGGSIQSCFLTREGGHVIGICFVPGKNPRAPDLIYVGRGPRKESAAAALINQAEAIPLFAKQGTNEWQFIGIYKGTKYSQSAADVDTARRQSGRQDVVGVLRLLKTPS